MSIDKSTLLAQLLESANNLTTVVEIERAKKDPYFFLTRFCYTMDEHDDKDNFKLFPKKEYIRDLCDLFVTEDLLLIEKSRQMMVSWIMGGLALWFTMYRPATRTFIMSKKEKDADALIDRIKVIYERLPIKIKEEYPVEQFTYLNIKWPKTNSIIQGLAQGPDQIRQYTASLVIMDEAAFQEKAEKTWQAIKPALVGGGKFVGVSTPNGKEWFYRMVHDL